MTKEELLQNIEQNIPTDGSRIITGANIREVFDNIAESIVTNSGGGGVKGTVKRVNGVYYYDFKPCYLYPGIINIDDVDVFVNYDGGDLNPTNPCLINSGCLPLCDKNYRDLYYLSQGYFFNLAFSPSKGFYVLEPISPQQPPTTIMLNGVTYEIEDVADVDGYWDSPCPLH